MEFVPNPEPVDPASEPVIDAAPTSADLEPRSRPGAVRRTVATLVLAAGLLIVGGVSAVWAASPDPSASTTPSVATPSATDTPDSSGTPRSGTDGTTHPKGDCPNKDGSSSGTDGSTESPSSSG